MRPPLNSDDWETISNASPPEGCFQFIDGKLLATANSNGKEHTPVNYPRKWLITRISYFRLFC